MAGRAPRDGTTPRCPPCSHATRAGMLPTASSWTVKTSPRASGRCSRRARYRRRGCPPRAMAASRVAVLILSALRLHHRVTRWDGARFRARPCAVWRRYCARPGGSRTRDAVGQVAARPRRLGCAATSRTRIAPSIVISKTTITMAQALFLLIVIVWRDGAGRRSQILGGCGLLVVEVAAVAGFLACSSRARRAAAAPRSFGVVTTPRARPSRRGARTYTAAIGGACAVRRVHLAVFCSAPSRPSSLSGLRDRSLRGPATVIVSPWLGVRFATFLIPGARRVRGANAFSSGRSGSRGRRAAFSSAPRASDRVGHRRFAVRRDAVATPPARPRARQTVGHRRRGAARDALGDARQRAHARLTESAPRYARSRQNAGCAGPVETASMSPPVGFGLNRTS